MDYIEPLVRVSTMARRPFALIPPFDVHFRKMSGITGRLSNQQTLYGRP